VTRDFEGWGLFTIAPAGCLGEAWSDGAETMTRAIRLIVLAVVVPVEPWDVKFSPWVKFGRRFGAVVVDQCPASGSAAINAAMAASVCTHDRYDARSRGLES